MFETSTLTWTMTMGLVLALFALDLTLGRLRPHRGGFPEAALCSVAHVAVAVAVGAWFLLTHGIDLLFALDSTPTVFGAVTAPFIVFTVNAFVLLGLRALSLLIKVLLERLVGLSAGLAVHHRLHRRHVGPAVAARRHLHTRFPRPLSRSRSPRSSGS